MVLSSLLHLWRSAQFGFTGFRYFTQDGFLAASRSFDNSVMERDMKGRTCYVTGANQGIGLQASLDLAGRNATLFMVCRNKQRGEHAVQRVREETGNVDVHLKVCDISSLQQVRALAKDVEQHKLPCHVLVNNAGCLRHGGLDKSADGYEINFATNTLGTYALTAMMLPALRRGAASPCKTARVIMVSSGGMYSEGLEVNDLEMAKERRFDAVVQYAKDKRRQVAMAERFTQLHGHEGLAFYSMHPGWTATEGVKEALPGFSDYMAASLRSLPQGADTITWLALADDTELQPGAFYLDRKPQSKHLLWAFTQYNSAAVDTLWDQLSSMSGAA